MKVIGIIFYLTPLECIKEYKPPLLWEKKTLCIKFNLKTYHLQLSPLQCQMLQLILQQSFHLKRKLKLVVWMLHAFCLYKNNYCTVNTLIIIHVLCCQRNTITPSSAQKFESKKKTKKTRMDDHSAKVLLSIIRVLSANIWDRDGFCLFSTLPAIESIRKRLSVILQLMWPY